MSDHICGCPGCTETEETGTMYKEEGPHGSFAVCAKHMDTERAKEGHVTVIMSSTNRAAEEANREILKGLQE